MPLESYQIYQAETARIAQDQGSMRDEACDRLLNNQPLNRLEEGGVLHGLQVLIENAIGKAKHIVKAHGQPVPLSGYVVFVALRNLGIIPADATEEWAAIIGLRNRLV